MSIAFESKALGQPPQPMMVKPGQPFGGPGGPSRPPGQPPTGKQPGKPDANGGEKKAANDSPEPKIIRRGDTKTGEADPGELKATVGADGKVAFQFRGQSWVDLVQWLAQIADQPLDWQELPGDRVNLRSPGRYTVEETKDLFNRHLLARGYTLLEMPGGITVAKTEGINPAMVPRKDVGELANLMPNTFVRTSLDLGWLSSEKMAEELKPMISSNGRLTALTTTNRIEAMDAAINLRQVASLLEQERSQSSREALAPEFRLRHIPAETAKKMLEELLGVEQEKSSAPMTPQQMQMMQQMRQRGGQPTPQPKKPEISIVANTRQNSVFIRAPVDRIAIATEFINRIDVPGQSITSLADIESRIQVFRLSSIDPEKLIEIIMDMNVLEPGTHIRPDEDNKALIVSGSAADRFIIDRLIKRLDGSGRSFEVLQLRRLDAVDVAESINFLMGNDEKKDTNDNSRRYYGFGFGYNNDDKQKDDDEFRVAANARFRQVLLWANESEMEQVRNLLIKLGELPPPGGSQQTLRRIDASASPETFEYLQRLREQWAQISDSPLVLPSENQFVDPIATPVDDQKESAEDESTKPALDTTQNLTDAESMLVAAPADDNEKTGTGEQVGTGEQESAGPQPGTIRSSREFAREFDRASANQAAPKPRATRNSNSSDPSADPIRIELDDDGNLLLMGTDTKALDQLENLMLQVSPPKRPYHVFKIKNQTAGYVRLNLVEYFEDLEDDDSGDDDFFRYIYGFNQSSQNKDGPKGLSKDKELRFVYDPDTNTIVVTGATSSQLKTISELIELWDVAEPVNKRRMRYTDLVTLEYGNAEQIAETVKEAYRDLLSSNDKTFAAAGGGRGGGGGGGGGPGGGGNNKSSGRERQGSGLVDSENGRDGGDVDFSFKGKLSMGIDPVGNTLLVSAEGEPLLELVVEMIRKLDRAAKPGGDVQIISLSGNTSDESIRNALKAFGGSAPAAKPAAATPPQPRRPRNPAQGG